MNPLNGLAEYLQRIERRLRMLAVSRGVALAAGAALAFTVLGGPSPTLLRSPPALCSRRGLCCSWRWPAQ